MKTDNIDSEIKKIINGFDDYYDREAAKSKERIWQQVQLKKKSRSRVFLLRALAAACILLLIISFVVTNENIKANRKINVLVGLNNTLQAQINTNKANTLKQNKLLAATNINLPDTIYIEKKVLVSKPVVQTKQFVDTVYIERKVVVEKEQPKEREIANNNISTDTGSQVTTISHETQILIRGSEQIKQKKGRKLQFKFGGNRNQPNEGTLAFTTEL